MYVRRTRADKDDAGDVDMELFGDDMLEHPSVDEEWLVLVNSSVGLDLPGSILVLEIPIPFEFLWRLLRLIPSSARHEWRK